MPLDGSVSRDVSLTGKLTPQCLQFGQGAGQRQPDAVVGAAGLWGGDLRRFTPVSVARLRAVNPAV
ncbi:MAG: hypothetical protein HWD57_06070 [Candidatus Accumulibacter cognatus]|uniref:Uncharacterized protein n=1 Tax=Candidatus Accumulibacter cognatus TaxID=2954383 RepID=A0A7D5S791_9PROT|nr:MAG: hypothetical protein HWD57_06070 [Candidatus Accumulibacter cognatus]